MHELKYALAIDASWPLYKFHVPTLLTPPACLPLLLMDFSLPIAFMPFHAI